MQRKVGRGTNGDETAFVDMIDIEGTGTGTDLLVDFVPHLQLAQAGLQAVLLPGLQGEAGLELVLPLGAGLLEAAELVGEPFCVLQCALGLGQAPAEQRHLLLHFRRLRWRRHTIRYDTRRGVREEA